MEPNEALQKLKELADKTNESDLVDLAKPHFEADKILVDLVLELLKEKGRQDLGEEINKTFQRIRKWYE